jgi:hypothetical protein
VFRLLNSSEFLSSCFCVSALVYSDTNRIDRERERLRACKDHGAHTLLPPALNPNTHTDPTCTYPSSFSIYVYTRWYILLWFLFIRFRVKPMIINYY